MHVMDTPVCNLAHRQIREESFSWRIKPLADVQQEDVSSNETMDGSTGMDL